VQKYYQLGDIFVAASTSETQGLTFIEAAANGLPLLCREDPCLNGVLLPGENGYTYTDEAGFQTALARMTADFDGLQRAGHRSEEIAEGFGTKAFGAAVERIYREVIMERSAMEGVWI